MAGELLDQSLERLRRLDQHLVDGFGRLLQLLDARVSVGHHLGDEAVALVELVEGFEDGRLFLVAGLDVLSDLIDLSHRFIYLIFEQPLILSIELLCLFQFRLQLDKFPLGSKVFGHSFILKHFIACELFKLSL